MADSVRLTRLASFLIFSWMLKLAFQNGLQARRLQTETSLSAQTTVSHESTLDLCS